MPDATTQTIIWSATPTPFLADGSLDDASIHRLVAQHLKLKVAGLFLGGTCGEGPLMPNEQRADLVKRVRRAAGKQLHLAVQVSDTSTARVRQNIDQAVDAGADSVVIAAPWFRAYVSADFARRYFLESLEHRTTAPVAVYVTQQPPETGIDLALWKEVAVHPKVAYLKDSSSLPDYRDALLKIRAGRPGLRLLTGDEFNAVEYLAAGYDGALMGTAILNAGLIAQAARALREGQDQEAHGWQERSNRFLYDMFRPGIITWMSGLKYALRRAGIFSTEFTHLCDPLTDDDRRRIDAALEREREFI